MSIATGKSSPFWTTRPTGIRKIIMDGRKFHVYLNLTVG